MILIIKTIYAIVEVNIILQLVDGGQLILETELFILIKDITLKVKHKPVLRSRNNHDPYTTRNIKR